MAIQQRLQLFHTLSRLTRSKIMWELTPFLLGRVLEPAQPHVMKPLGTIVTKSRNIMMTKVA
ncbi:hypothetical protein CKO42_02730 [Lamprobacter modestohalophilus]|uniref:Uncharacterized protein n=1 Tax=Lamprobacter modestohalophilus TaxID=1064514 RepID=A0A9X1B383_9GAMM|nr:hypothetical protein [Lamprobacter modestohalophilus]